MLTTELWAPHEVLLASITGWKIYLYLGLNTLLTVSGLLLIALQYKSVMKPIVDTSLTAILLDSSQVIGMNVKGLCNVKSLSEVLGASKLRVRLRLWNPADALPLKHHHLMLISDQTADEQNVPMTREDDRISML